MPDTRLVLSVGLCLTIFFGSTASGSPPVNCSSLKGRNWTPADLSDVSVIDDSCPWSVVLELVKELQARPAIPTTVKELHVDVKASFSLNCSAAIPNGWTDAGVLISLSNEGKDKTWHGTDATVIPLPNGMRSWTFHIQDSAEKSLSGNYTCMMQVTSPAAGTYNTSWTVPVVVHEQLQVDIKETVNATEDKAVDILCTVKGNPIPPDVTWYTAAKNDSFKQILSNDMTYNFTSAEPGGEFARVFTLTIMNPKVTMNHRQYRCSAFDRISNSTITSTNATLSVTKATIPPTTTTQGNGNSTDSKQSPTSAVSVAAIAVAVVVLVVLCGAVYVVYWKRQMLRDWLMEKDVVKVIKKQKKTKGYRYSKLPKNISASMKHLE